MSKRINDVDILMNKEIKTHENDFEYLMDLLPYSSVNNIRDIIKILKKDPKKNNEKLKIIFQHFGKITSIAKELNDIKYKELNDIKYKEVNDIKYKEVNDKTLRICEDIEEMPLSLAQILKKIKNNENVSNNLFVKSLSPLPKINIRWFIKELKKINSLEIYKEVLIKTFSHDEFVRIRLFDFTKQNIINWLKNNQFVLDINTQIYVASLFKKFKIKLEDKYFNQSKKEVIVGNGNENENANENENKSLLKLLSLMIKSNNCSRKHFGLLIYLEIVNENEVDYKMIEPLFHDFNFEVRHLINSKPFIKKTILNSTKSLFENELCSLDVGTFEGAAHNILKCNRQELVNYLKLNFKDLSFLKYPGYIYLILLINKNESSSVDKNVIMSRKDNKIYTFNNNFIYTFINNLFDNLFKKFQIDEIHILPLRSQKFVIDIFILKSKYNLVFDILLSTFNLGLIIYINKVLKSKINETEIDISIGFKYLEKGDTETIFRKSAGLSVFFSLCKDYKKVIFESLKFLQFNDCYKFHILNILDAVFRSNEILPTDKIIINTDIDEINKSFDEVKQISVKINKSSDETNKPSVENNKLSDEIKSDNNVYLGYFINRFKKLNRDFNITLSKNSLEFKYLSPIIENNIVYISDIFTFLVLKFLDSEIFMVKNSAMNILTSILKNNKKLINSKIIREYIYSKRENPKLTFYLLMIYEYIVRLNINEINFIKDISEGSGILTEKGKKHIFSLESIKAKNIINLNFDEMIFSCKTKLVFVRKEKFYLYLNLIKILNSEYSNEIEGGIEYINNNLIPKENSLSQGIKTNDDKIIKTFEEGRIFLSKLIKKDNLKTEILKELIELRDVQMEYSFSDLSYDIELINE